MTSPSVLPPSTSNSQATRRRMSFSSRSPSYSRAQTEPPSSGPSLLRPFPPNSRPRSSPQNTNWRTPQARTIFHSACLALWIYVFGLTLYHLFIQPIDQPRSKIQTPSHAWTYVKSWVGNVSEPSAGFLDNVRRRSTTLYAAVALWIAAIHAFEVIDLLFLSRTWPTFKQWIYRACIIWWIVECFPVVCHRVPHVYLSITDCKVLHRSRSLPRLLSLPLGGA